jgi:hypothetical protein
MKRLLIFCCVLSLTFEIPISRLIDIYTQENMELLDSEKESEDTKETEKELEDELESKILSHQGPNYPLPTITSTTITTQPYITHHTNLGSSYLETFSPPPEHILL